MTKFSILLHVLKHLDCVLNSEGYLYSFRVFTEASLHHFAPTEVCLSWKSFLLDLSQEAGDCLSPRVVLRKCQHRTILSTLHLGNLQSFSSLPSSLKLPSLGIHFLEILLWWSCLAIHVIFEKEKSSPWELSSTNLLSSKSKVWFCDQTYTESQSAKSKVTDEYKVQSEKTRPLCNRVWGQTKTNTLFLLWNIPICQPK